MEWSRRNIMLSDDIPEEMPEMDDDAIDDDGRYDAWS